MSETAEPSANANVARAGGIMMASLFLSRVLGFIKGAAIAAMFGSTALTDAYFTSFQIPDLIFYLVAGGALSSSFIPVFSEYYHTYRRDEAWHVFSSIATLMGLIVTAVVIVLWFAAPTVLPIIAPGQYNADIAPVIVQMSRIVLPCQIAFFLGGLMFGTLYSRQNFTVPGLGPNLYNIGIISGALIISHFVSPGELGMSYGALIGAFLGSIVVPIIAMRKMGSHYQFVIDLKHPGVKKVFKLMLPVVLGLSLPGVYAMIMRAFGGFYAAGWVTALENANQLMQAPLAIFGQSMALAIFPALSQFFAQGRMDQYRDQMEKTLRTVLYLGMAASALLTFLAYPVVDILFGYNKYTPEAVQRTADALQMFGIGVAAWCLHPVLMRGFFSIQKTVTPIVLGTLATLTFLGLSWVSVNILKLPASGLPLAGSITAILLVVVLVAALAREMGGMDWQGLGLTFLKSLLAAATFSLWLVAVNLSWMTFSPPGGKVTKVILVVPAVLIGLWIYYFATKKLGMPETAYFDRAFAKLNRKGA